MHCPLINSAWYPYPMGLRLSIVSSLMFLLYKEIKKGSNNFYAWAYIVTDKWTLLDKDSTDDIGSILCKRLKLKTKSLKFILNADPLLGSCKKE
jgi:hypothetical protein